MMSDDLPTVEEIDKLYKRLDAEAEQSGYHLNPDAAFTRELVKGLLVNGKRYGYWACPCRLADGERAMDLDIICPCDYRDQDIDEFGNCYCRLYVSAEIKNGRSAAAAIPERRPPSAAAKTTEPAGKLPWTSSVPVWRCRVCGYLCGREHPPAVCPVCKASKDRFELFV
jgi:ferredoxin-thioredoxin reductase catalytic chain